MIDTDTVSIANNYENTTSCDHRTSRAALHILLNDAIPILRRYSQDERTLHDQARVDSRSATDTTTISPASMKEYEYLLSQFILDESSSKCLLSPTHFGLGRWQNEMATTSSFTRTKRFGAVQATIGKATKSNYFNSAPITLYVCPICQKSFVNRYYLDQHMMQHHADEWMDEEQDHDHLSEINNRLRDPINKNACPSEELCPFLGWRTCQQIALDLEPFHGPGGNIGADDEQGQRRGVDYHHHHTIHLQSIQRAYQRILHEHPCQPMEMEYSRNLCDSVVDSCFIEKNTNLAAHDGTGVSNMSQLRNSIAHDLKRVLCDRQTCHHGIFQHIAFGRQPSNEESATTATTSSTIGVHHSRDLFDEVHDYFSSGGFGLWFILLIFFIVYGGWFFVRHLRYSPSDRYSTTSKTFDVNRRKKFE